MHKSMKILSWIAVFLAIYLLYVIFRNFSFVPHGSMNPAALAEYLGEYEPISSDNQGNLSLYITRGILFVDGVGQFPLKEMNIGWTYHPNFFFGQIRIRYQFDGKILTYYR